MRASACIATIAVWWTMAPVCAAPPRVAQGYRLEMVAEAPEIVTPIGMAFDRRGRLLVVESHTHQRGKEQQYAGLPADRIRRFFDSDGDGRPDKWETVAEGFHDTMMVQPRADGALYVVTRRDVQLVLPSAPGQAAEVKAILRLETENQYSHNALGGIAVRGDGSLLVGMGENHGMEFRLVGSDGTSVSGRGEGGYIFQCTSDGGMLAPVAVGFWNPCSLCVTPGGRVLAVDNDPDASPPCRLLEVAPAGDYGFRFRYGRSGLHPLQAWNGELPGTLPMICGVGEAPTALVLHRGALWVTSWGDYRIERYTLVPRGASFSATRDLPVQGDADFRPTGMAAAPDGSLYFGDWVVRDYPVHGRGRIWRLTLPADSVVSHDWEKLPPASAEAADADIALASNDPFTQAAGVWECVKDKKLGAVAWDSSRDARVRLGRLQALRFRGAADPQSILAAALADPSAEVRLFAARWIADERMVDLRDKLAKLLEGPQEDTKYYLTVLAAVDWLDNERKPPSSGFTNGLLAKELQNASRSVGARVLMLSLLSPDDKFLTIERLREYLNSDYPALRLEAARALAQRSSDEKFAVLAELATDEKDEAIRAEAIMGLASAEPYRELLERITADPHNPNLQREARRALRLGRGERQSDGEKPAAEDIAAWLKLVKMGGDAEAGRRLFFSAVAGSCRVCHQYEGRGGRIGPDLTQVARSASPERILTSILQPSREIAPEYQAWVLETTDGHSKTGLRLPKPGDDGVELYADPAGERFTLRSEVIERRTAAAKSIMPDGMEQLLSVDDLRDLLAFLTRRAQPRPQ